MASAPWADFRVQPWMSFAAANEIVPCVALALYLSLLAAGPLLMRQRPAFSLRGLLFAWNALLSIYSATGFFFMAQHAGAVLSTQGLASTLRGPLVYSQGAPAFWLTLFMFSKLPELLDTLFLVLRKKPLTFLHCYHHASVMLYCWYAFSLQSHLGFYFTTMNYAVHAIMYCYYALTSLGFAPPWGTAVTLLQISQMFCGSGLCAYSWVVGEEARGSLAAGALLYASYLVLFVQFFVQKKGRAEKGGKET